MTHFAFISPRDGFAGVLSHDGKYVTLVAPSAQKDTRLGATNYIDRFRDTSVLEVATPEEALSHLAEFKENSHSLDFTLALFDRHLSIETRQKVVSVLDSSLRNVHCRNYILDIVLAAPLPAEADLESATAISSGWDKVNVLVSTILECQPRVQIAHSALMSIRDDSMVQKTGFENVHGALIRFGIFRQLVEQGRTQSEVTKIKNTVVVNPALNAYCDPRILIKFITEYSLSLPLGSSISSAQRQDIQHLRADQEIIASTQSKPRINYADADINRERAEKQVNRIVDLFVEGEKDVIAYEYLDELIESQTLEGANHEYVVKSLCNIAKKCATGGRSDVSFECLRRAFNYEEKDLVLFFQMGVQFRELKKYAEAFRCFEEALKLNKDHRDVSIRHELIRTSVAMGDYDAALKSYSEIPSLFFDANLLCGLGALYRRMGKLHEAHDSYSRALDIDKHSHVAFAGFAECNKQNGRIYKAINRYNAIFDRFSNLEEKSHKIYSLALAFLYRLTHQWNRADKILQELLAMYPKDADVHFHLAKLYLLQGNSSLARHHFREAYVPSLDSVSSQLFMTAFGEQFSKAPSTKSNSEVKSIVMPEDAGLVTCHQAFLEIQNENYNDAVELLARAHFVDRLQADFGAVLAYHAKVKSIPSFNYKLDHGISRVAKRSHKLVKHCVKAISEGDFIEATNCERQLCILLP